MANNDYRSGGSSGGYGNRQQSRPQQQRPTQEEQRTPPRREMPPPAGAGNQAPAVFVPHKQKVFEKFGAKYGVDPEVLASTLKQTCFKKPRNSDVPISNEQLVALLIVADQYGLNPFTKEIYAYPDKENGIVPVVSIDGWIRIIQEHPQFDGMEFAHSDTVLEDKSSNEEKFKHKPCWDWFEVTIYRKDRSHATPVTEYFDEVYRPALNVKNQNNEWYKIATPWQTHTKRMLRHKTIIQAGRVTMGFAGIYDDDEAQRIVGEDDSVVLNVPAGQAQTRSQAAKEALRPAGSNTASRATSTPAPTTAPKPTPTNGKHYTGDPWEEPGASPEPQTQEPAPQQPTTEQGWRDAMKAATTREMLDDIWDAALAWFDTRPVDLDTEATYHMMKEELTQ